MRGSSLAGRGSNPRCSVAGLVPVESEPGEDLDELGDVLGGLRVDEMAAWLVVGALEVGHTRSSSLGRAELDTVD